MRRSKVKLDSLHYSEETFRDLIHILTSNSESSQLRIKTYDEHGVRVFENIDSLFESPFSPKDIMKFEITIRTDFGTGTVSGNGRTDQHVLSLSGEEDWVSGRKDAVKSFSRRNEYSKIRSFFDIRARISAILISIGILTSTQVKFLLPFFGIPIYHPYTIDDASFLLLGSAIIAISATIDYISPFVMIRTDGEEEYSSTRKVWKSVLVLSTIVGLISGLLQLFKHI